MIALWTSMNVVEMRVLSACCVCTVCMLGNDRTGAVHPEVSEETSGQG